METPCLSDCTEPVRAGLGRPCEGLPVHRNQAELRSVPERPLEVVEQGPIEIAAHVDAFVKAAEDLPQRRADVAGTLRVVLRCDPIFGNEDRRAASTPPGPADRPPQRGGVVLLAELRDVVRLLGSPHTPLDMRAARALRPETIARVGLHADEGV